MDPAVAIYRRLGQARAAQLRVRLERAARAVVRSGVPANMKRTPAAEPN
jgi:hypothetical protein